MFTKHHSDYLEILAGKNLFSRKKSFKNWNKVNMALFNSRITNEIYHGCTTRYANGKRKLIDFCKCERCLIPTSNPFWKQPSDSYLMQTTNSTKKRQLIIGWFEYIKKILTLTF